MLDLDSSVLLWNVVLVNHEIFAPDVWNEEAIRILHQQLEGHQTGGRIEMDFGFLLSLPPLEQRSISAIRYSSLSLFRRLRVPRLTVHFRDGPDLTRHPGLPEHRTQLRHPQTLSCRTDRSRP